MLQLPPGFNYSQLFTDYISCALPFAAIAGLFAAYRIIRKSAEYMGGGREH